MAKSQAKQKRSRGKALPDLRPVGYTDPAPASEKARAKTRPTIDQYKELARKHGIKDEGGLAKQLDKAWYWWQADQVIPPSPKGSDVRRLLGAISERAALLQEALEKAGPSERTLVAELDARLDLRSLIRDLDRLERAAKEARQKVPNSQAGAHGRRALRELLSTVRSIYVDAFGREAPRLTQSDEFGGRFYEFAKDVMATFGAPQLSNKAVGKRLQKSIKLVDTKAE